MSPETEGRLACYEQLGDVDSRHGVRLLRHRDTGELSVLKKLKIYDLRVYRQLQEEPAAGIPRIRELIGEGDFLYVVEEYIPGRTLRSVLDSRGTLEEDEALELLSQLCRILEPLHRQYPPIVHRDVKPGNLILTEEGRLVLVDFNSAKASMGDWGQDTVLIGTQGYAAPEQYGFSVSRPTADVYAMGVLLNEMITGSMPNRARCGGRAGKIAERCLQMDPANRYQDAGELLRAIEASRPAAPRPAAPEKNPRKKAGGKHRWLPPGFRAGNPVAMVLMGLWYALVLWMSFTLELEGEDVTAAQVIGNRLLFFLVFMTVTLWCGNYLDVWKKLPLSGSKNLLVCAVGVVWWAAVLGFGLLVIGLILMSFL